MKTDFKVLMTLMDLKIGGAQTHVVELARELTKKGVTVFVASNGGVYEKELKDAGITHFPVPLHNKNPFNMLGSYLALKKIIRENDIRLVHAHARIPAFICGLLAKKLGFRFVTTAHWVFSTALPFKILSNWGEEALAVSEDIKDYLIKNYGYDPEKVFVTINGIDLDKFSAETDSSVFLKEFKLDDQKKRVLSISRLDKDRSLPAHRLIECAERLYELNRKLEIVIAGNGDDYYNVKAKAEEVNKRLGKKLIIMTGSRTDINALVAGADIVVAVSRSALEAMAAERPVVLAGNEGYAGIFREDILEVSVITNFCFRGFGETTADELYADLMKLLRYGGDKLRALGAYGRETARRLYSVEKMAGDALTVYEKLLRRDKPVDILISGYYGSNNHGDESVLKAMLNDLRGIKSDLRITVLSRRPKETARKYGVKAIPQFSLGKISRELKNSAMLISGGGSLIQDVSSSRSLWYYLFIINMALKNHVRVMLYANGIGPVKRGRNIRKTVKTLKKVQRITLRDEDSAAALAAMGIGPENVVSTADPAFSLEYSGAGAGALLERLGLNGKKYFCVAVRSWKYSERDFEKDILNFCEYIYGKYRYSALFLPMQPLNDAAISKGLAGRMKLGGVYSGEGISTDEALSLIENSEFVLGMRLHSIIYAIKTAVPVVGLVYDPKVESVLRQFGQEYFGYVDSLDLEALKQYADFFIVNKEMISGRLAEMAAAAETKARENARIAMELFNGDCF